MATKVVVPLIARSFVHVKDDVGSALMNVLGWQSAGERTSEKQCLVPHTYQERVIGYHSDVEVKKDVVAIDITSIENEGASGNNNVEVDGTEKRLHPFFLRVCDLDLHISMLEEGEKHQKFACGPSLESGKSKVTRSQDESPIETEDPEFYRCTKKKIAFLELRHDTLTAQALNALVQIGLALSLSKESLHLFQKLHQLTIPPPVWQPVGSTAKLLKKHNVHNDVEESSLPVLLLQREVLLWTGKMSSGTTTDYYGRNISLFKARGVVDMSPLDFAELLLDNNRVRLYNRWSVCRTDALVLQKGIDTYSCDDDNNTDTSALGGGETKVVYSETKVPLTGMVVALTTLMHGRKLSPSEDANGCGGYVIISRSVNTENVKKEYSDGQTMPLPAKRGSQNEIIWGVNIMRNVSGCPQKTDLTVISQVNNSMMIPQFLERRIGIMGATDFFNRIRSL